MAWSTPPTWTPGQLVGATDMAILSNDLTYLLNRPSQTIKRDNNATYVTSSTTFVDIDGTNLSITATLSGSAVLVSFTACGVSGTGVSGNTICLDLSVNGTRMGSAGTDGITSAVIATNTGTQLLGFTVVVTGLSAGANTFKPQWKALTAAALNLYAGNGTGGADFIPVFSVAEIG